MSLKRKHNETTNRQPCARCLSMTSTLRGLKMLTSDGGFEHYDKKQLRKSARLDCPVCAILCYDLQIPSDLNGPLRIAAISICAHVDGVVHADSDHPFRSKKLIGLYVKTSQDESMGENRGLLEWKGIKAYTSHDDPAASHLPVLPVLVSVYGPEITQNIKDRLKICQEQHHECTPQEVPILPHRVIDVETGDNSISARLFINNDLQRGEYTCLSYCWGGPQDVATTTTLLKQYSICLPLDRLPQTIKDAINITRSLAIRYLWVDALCILQDSTSDKSVEVGEMGRIYRNAMVTIAAASSQRVTDGFLKDRTIPNAYQLPFYLSDGRFGSISLRACGKIGHEKVDPLESRGWTLQESLLSRRVLYYGSRDLLWKCRRESFVPVNKTHHFFFSTVGYELPASISSGKNGHHSERPRLQSKIWREVVNNYSRRDLTIFEDRLPALAGIVSELQSIWKDTYLAGMWRNCLIRQLGWQRNDYILKDLPSEPFRSPSWSWASSRGRVLFCEVYQEDARFVACDVIPVDSKSPFGRVESGKLTLRAAIKPIPISLNARAFGMDLGPGGRYSVDQDSRLLFLGYRPKGFGTFLIITPVGDDTYLRIGATTMSGTEMDLWRAPDLEREIVTLV